MPPRSPYTFSQENSTPAAIFGAMCPTIDIIGRMIRHLVAATAGADPFCEPRCDRLGLCGPIHARACGSHRWAGRNPRHRGRTACDRTRRPARGLQRVAAGPLRPGRRSTRRVRDRGATPRRGLGSVLTATAVDAYPGRCSPVLPRTPVYCGDGLRVRVWGVTRHCHRWPRVAVGLRKGTDDVVSADRFDTVLVVPRWPRDR